MKIVRRWVQLWLVVPLFYNCVVFNGGGFWFLVINYVFFNKKGGGVCIWYYSTGERRPQYYTVVGSLKFSFKKERGKRSKSF